MTTRDLAQDLVAVTDSLGVDRIDVYATSMGGRVAQCFAADHLDRVRRLVLACTSPGGEHAVERTREVRAALADPDRGRQTLRELMFTTAYLTTHPERTPVEGDPGMTAAARRDHLRASDRHDAWAVLPSITAPTLVLHRGDDVCAPVANAGLVAGWTPQAELRLFDGLRHGFFREAADDVGRVVLEFLA